jgi:hypothetical protein
MPTTYPIATSGERLPKRARPLPPGVKAAVKALVWGIEGDEGRRPATLAEAAAAGSMKMGTLRRWLHRADVRAEIAGEKKALLAWATSANPHALMSIRDNGANDAARVRAAMALEELESPRPSSGVNVNVGIQTNVSGAATVVPGYVIRHKAEPPMIEGETDSG